MALTKSFYQAVGDKNVRLVRIMMKDSLIVDPSFQQFDEMEKMAKNAMEIYEPHDGRELEVDRNKWTEEYMNKLMVQVISNFSRERIQHLKAVVRKLYPMTEKTEGVSRRANNVKPDVTQKIDGEARKSNERESYQERKRRDQQEGNYINSEYLAGAAAGAVLGGVAGAVAGVIGVGETVIGGIVAGAAVGAAAGVGIVASMTGGNKKDE